jgi:hypothetical protein
MDRIKPEEQFLGWSQDYLTFPRRTQPNGYAGNEGLYLTWKEPMYLESSVATQLDTWTKGPSLPSGIPAPRVAVRPTTLATRVLHKMTSKTAVNYRLKTGHLLAKASHLAPPPPFPTYI